MILRFALLLLPTFCTGQWIECDGVSSVKAGSCNSAAAPCKAGSGVFNAGKVIFYVLCITYPLFSFVFTEQAVYVNDVCLMTACYTVGNLFQCIAFDTPPF